jgi:hypothetical protein
MKKHKLDKLFSDKLNDFENQPSAAAWERLEESLERKSQKQIWAWISIAASAMLVAFSSWYMLADSTSMNYADFTYSDDQINEVKVPYEIVMVPVFIRVPVDSSPAVVHEMISKNPEVRSERKENMLPTTLTNTPVALASNSSNNYQLTPDEQLPKSVAGMESEDLNTDQTTGAIAENSIDTHEPLTIIYKQSEPESESNFNKAINYVVEVRNGDKKLVNFKKIKENIKSKLKLNKEVNSI